MSKLVYATKVRCDWPGCPEAAVLPVPESTTILPPDWADIGGGAMPPRNLVGRELRDFCPRHSLRSVAELAEMLREMPPGVPGG